MGRGNPKLEHKVDLGELSRLLGEGFGNSEIARKMKVNPSSITRAIKKMEGHAPKIVALEKAGEFVEAKGNLLKRYQETDLSLSKFRQALEKYIYEGDRTTFAAMQRRIESKSVENEGSGEGKKEKVKGYRGKGRKTRAEMKVEHFDFSVDPKALLIQVNRAIIELMRLEADIVIACADPQKVLIILNKIIEVMERIDPKTKYEIEQILKADGLIRSVISFGSPDQTDMRSQDGRYATPGAGDPRA